MSTAGHGRLLLYRRAEAECKLCEIYEVLDVWVR